MSQSMLLEDGDVAGAFELWPNCNVGVPVTLEQSMAGVLVKRGEYAPLTLDEEHAILDLQSSLSNGRHEMTGRQLRSLRRQMLRQKNIDTHHRIIQRGNQLSKLYESSMQESVLKLGMHHSSPL